MSRQSAKSIAYMKGRGYEVENAEHWCPHPPPGHRKDMFGFADLFCVPDFKREEDRRTILVQATSHPHVADRERKINGSKWAYLLLVQGYVIEIHGWRKGKRLAPSDPKKPNPVIVRLELEEKERSCLLKSLEKERSTGVCSSVSSSDSILESAPAKSCSDVGSQPDAPSAGAR